MHPERVEGVGRDGENASPVTSRRSRAAFFVHHQSACWLSPPEDWCPPRQVKAWRVLLTCQLRNHLHTTKKPHSETTYQKKKKKKMTGYATLYVFVNTESPQNPGVVADVLSLQFRTLHCSVWVFPSFCDWLFPAVNAKHIPIMC